MIQPSRRPAVDKSSRPPTERRKPVALHVAVASEDQSYPVLIGAGLLARIGHELRRSHASVRRVALVSDSNVMPIYGEAARASLEAEGFEVHAFTIPAGEQHKTVEQLVELTEGMIEASLGRRDALVALGGGVVGDLAGLAAALFMRGIPFVQCPTSLLAQVDSSVGGKTAVDLPAGKNLLGAFHFPSVVVIDPEVLQTLSDRELACGLAEMLKHGALFSRDHFNQVVECADRIFARDAEVLARMVASSVALKAACVSRDPRELGEAGKGRVLLNLGHTVGHALERLSNFTLLHGEAVGLGLIAAARLSVRKGVGEPDLEQQMRNAVASLRLPADLDHWLGSFSPAQLENALSNDKKRGATDPARAATSISYIALARVGEPTVQALTAAEIVALLRESNPSC
jgi:3-dehydroquinate synthase